VAWEKDFGAVVVGLAGAVVVVVLMAGAVVVVVVDAVPVRVWICWISDSMVLMSFW